MPTTTGTLGFARILCTLPRLPPCQPSTTSVDQSAEACPYPTTVRLSGYGWRPTTSKGAAKKQVKSGNFNWFYRQLYYALNREFVAAMEDILEVYEGAYDP